MEWISNIDWKTMFDGWGTQLVVTVVTLVVGGIGVVSYKRGKSSQTQKAGNYAKQRQEVKNSDNKKVSQSQEAGNDADQTQIG